MTCVGCASQPEPQMASPTITPIPAAPRVTGLGTSVQGRPIQMVTFGPTTGRPVLIIGGIHGSEPTSAYVAEQLVAHLRANPKDATRPVAIIANANPDGLLAKTRGNAKGVDVNRNFPASNWKAVRNRLTNNGPAPSSEPESVAIQQAINSLNPDRIVSIHSIERGRHCNNYDGPARWLAEAMNKHNHYPVTETMGYPTPGSLGSWAGIDRQIPIVTLELARQDPGSVAWAQNKQALLVAINMQRPG
jgi:predicted deacylase